MVEWRIFHKDVTSSTNDDAAKGSHGDVFTAGFQTAGRGRGDHAWEGEKNAALMMSAVLATGGCSPAYVATFPLVAGLATMEGLRRLAGPALLLDIGIKWPNDVLCGGRKVAGLLCRREDERIVVGIGVNVKQKSFPKAIAGRAVSLAMLGVDASIEDAREAILEALSPLYGEWLRAGASGGTELPCAIMERLAAADLLEGRRISVVGTDVERRIVEGVAGGISPDGALVVDGEKIYSGEAVELLSK